MWRFAASLRKGGCEGPNLHLLHSTMSRSSDLQTALLSTFVAHVGSQYTAIHFGETLTLSGLRPSIGSVGDAYDNALAETTIGLYKNECIRADSPFRRGPLRNLGDVELITAHYVSWYNQQRLMHRLGRIPPTEAEAEYSRSIGHQPIGRVTEPRGCMKPGTVQQTPTSRRPRLCSRNGKAAQPFRHCDDARGRGPNSVDFGETIVLQQFPRRSHGNHGPTA